MKVDINNRQIMYSVNKEGQVIVHRFMIDKDTKEGKQKLQKYLDRGYTYEKPVIQVIEEPVIQPKEEQVIKIDELTEPLPKEVTDILCPECGKECKSELGLSAHMRVHKGE